MNHTSSPTVLTVLSSLCLVTTACGSEKPKVEAAPTEAAQDGQGGQQEATGELRDALIALEKVHFALNSSDLPQESRDALAEAAPKLQRNGVDLHVDGHTDERGTEEYNAALGQERATAVVDY
ncbi:MAG: OmpA family protein, partial [Myxococcales bacterium]|nr:OmpA family protein [Myxococcales bacterium]